MGITIRRMEIRDIDKVLKIERESFPSPWGKENFLYELMFNRFSHYFVAEEDGEVVGYIGAWIFLDETHIVTIATRGDRRGRGIGGKLLEEVLKLSREMGARRAFIEVREGNEIARRFYEKHGFKVYGKRFKYYRDTGEDAILMEKDLSE